MIFKVFLCFFQCALTLILRYDSPSFLEILIFELVLELIEHCSPVQTFDGVVPDTTPAALPAATLDEHIPVVHCFTVWKICEAPRPEGQVCSTARSNSLASNSTQRCRTNDYSPCRRIIKPSCS
ncbi:hypothetical protein TNCV_103501 [Trichonephila clavipes]|nr:hypothetical protein TNCV_103501 [Trichonephila clavipes]